MERIVEPWSINSSHVFGVRLHSMEFEEIVWSKVFVDIQTEVGRNDAYRLWLHTGILQGIPIESFCMIAHMIQRIQITRELSFVMPHRSFDLVLSIHCWFPDADSLCARSKLRESNQEPIWKPNVETATRDRQNRFLDNRLAVDCRISTPLNKLLKL